MKRLLIICLAIVFLNTTSLIGQDWAHLKYGLLEVNLQQVDFSDFNQQSSSMNYPALASSMMEITGGWAVHDGRWRRTYALSFAQMRENPTETPRQVKYQQVGAMFGNSFSLVDPSSPWRIGPEVVLRFQGEQVTMVENRNVNSLQAATQVEFTKLTRFHTPIDLGFQVQRGFGLQQRNQSFLTLGVRAGYRLGHGEDWQVNSAVDIVGLEIRPGGWYTSLQLGMRLY